MATFPNASRAVIVTLTELPAVLEPAAVTSNVAAAAGLTVIPELVPVMVPVTVSVAVSVREPAVFRV